MREEQVTGILLAAGSSRRMGESKLNLPFEQSTVGGMSLTAAVDSSLRRTLVVSRTSGPPPWITMLPTEKRNWEIVRSRYAERGQSYSLRSGVQAAEAQNAAAVMILLGDQPLFPAAWIDELIDQHIRRQPAFTAASFNGSMRPPVIFSRRLFPALKKISGDKGARRVLKSLAPGLGITVPIPEEKAFYDVDTKEDYEWLLNEMRVPLLR